MAMKNTFVSYRDRIAGWPFIACTLFGTAIAAIIILIPLTYILVLLFGIGLLVCSAYKPELGIIILVIFISSILYEESLPLIPIGIGSLHIPDILLLFMFSLVVIKRFSNNKNTLIISPLEKPLAFFLLLTTILVFVSIKFFGINFNTVLRTFRPISYYLIFYIITNLIITKKQIKFLVTGLFFVAAVVALAMLIQTTAGKSISWIPQSQTIQAGGLYEEYNTLRLLPPGQTLLFASFMVATCFIIFYRGKSLLLSGYYYLIILLGIGVMLTFTRTYLVGILLSTGFFLFLAENEDRKRLMALMAWFVTFIILLLMVSLGTGGKLDSAFNDISKRYLTLFAGKDLVQSSSLSDRYLENSYAIQQIKEHPVLGIGLGNDYRPAIYGSEDAIKYYVHNAYLYLIIDMGIPGFAFFMWFYAGFLIRALKNHKKPEDDFLKSVATGSMLAGIGMLPMALVIPLFMEWHSIVVLATLIGLSETIIINTKVQIEN